MEVSFINSVKTAIQFVRARRRFDESPSEEVRQRYRDAYTVALSELQNDPLAQQLLPSAEEYVRLETERRLAIERATLLGKLNSKLMEMQGGSVAVQIGDFKDTSIEFQLEDFCTAAGTLPRGMANKVIVAVSELLQALILDLLVCKNLSPPPEFTI